MQNSVIFSYGNIEVNGISFSLTANQGDAYDLMVDGVRFSLKEEERVDEFLYSVGNSDAEPVTILDARGNELTMCVNQSLLQAVA